MDNDFKKHMEVKKLISTDTSNLINSLLIYKMTSKLLSPAEINSIIKYGSDTISEGLSSDEKLLMYLDKNTINEIVKNTSNKILKLIKSNVPGETG